MGKVDYREVRWLLKEMRHLWPVQAVSLVCVLAGSALTLAGPLILKWLIDEVLAERRGGQLLLGTTVYGLTTAGQLAFNYAGYLLGYLTLERLVFRIRMSRLRKLHTVSARYFEDTPVGEIQYRLEQDVDRIGELGADIVPGVLRTVAMVTMVLVTMAILNLHLTLLVLPLLPVIYLLQKRHFIRLRKAADQAQLTLGETSAGMQEHLRGMIQLQLLNRTGFHGRKIARLAAAGVRARMRQRRAEVQFSAASMALIVLGNTAILGYGGREVMHGVLTVGGLVAFYSYLAQLLGPLSSAVDLQSRIQRVGASIRRIREVGQELQQIRTSGERSGAASEAALDFDSVSFSHRQDRLVLDNLNLTIAEGEHVALAGQSGCGKTTIAHLAAGLYVRDQGRILVKGKEPEMIGRRGLRSLISIVPQTPLLFNATLRENLLYGNPRATRRELESVVEVAQLEEVLQRMPGSFDEHLGASGTKLSGGETKRVALARALLQKPGILILDEVTGALDSLTARRLIDALGEFRDGRTTIWISHEPLTLATADRVILLAQGHVMDEGSHLELLARCVYYRRFYADITEAG